MRRRPLQAVADTRGPARRRRGGDGAGGGRRRRQRRRRRGGGGGWGGCGRPHSKRTRARARAVTRRAAARSTTLARVHSFLRPRVAPRRRRVRPPAPRVVPRRHIPHPRRCRAVLLLAGHAVPGLRLPVVERRRVGRGVRKLSRISRRIRRRPGAPTRVQTSARSLRGGGGGRAGGGQNAAGHGVRACHRANAPEAVALLHSLWPRGQASWQSCVAQWTRSGSHCALSMLARIQTSIYGTRCILAGSFPVRALLLNEKGCYLDVVPPPLPFRTNT